MRAYDDITAVVQACDRDVCAESLRSRPIALVAGSLDIVGGQEVQAAILCERFREQGYKLEFVPINPRFPRAIRWLRRVPYFRTVVNELLYLPRLARLRRAGVVHVFSASYWSFLLAPVPAMLAAKAFRKRVVLNYHSGEAADHLSRWGMLVHPFLKLADEIVVPSEYLRGVFARHGYRARVIRNVVDTSRFRFRERRPLRARILSTRNLEPIYRIDDTLRAFALLRARRPEATLTIAGSGSEEKRLRRLAAPFGDAVRFIGRVDPASMPRVYDDADIFVNSSVVDNQPLSILEAFAAGLPVVSTPTGEIANMVREGQTGSIAPAGSPEAIADAIARLLTDPDTAIAMARRARAEVDQYTWPAVRNQWEAVYSGRAA